MNPYITTLQVVGGLLTPIIVIIILLIILQGIKGWRESTEYKKNELEKYRVFDSEAEFYEVPNPTMIGVRLKKGDKVVWEGGIDREGSRL
jgi:hypothetical protein